MNCWQPVDTNFQARNVEGERERIKGSSHDELSWPLPHMNSMCSIDLPAKVRFKCKLNLEVKSTTGKFHGNQCNLTLDRIEYINLHGIPCNIRLDHIEFI